MAKAPSIFIMVDMEGISGIFQSSQVLADQPAYQAGRRYMTSETNACIDGCFQGGAGRVVVRDAHSLGSNFLWDELDDRAEYIQGCSGPARLPEIASFDGLILLGYHAMAGTPQAILEHTMNSKLWQDFSINERRCGEIAIDAGIAGDHNVPTLMVSGDDKTCLEARQFIPDVVTVQVKQGLDCQGGQLLSKQRAHELIREGAATAVRRCREIRPFKISSPVTLRLELVSRGQVPANRPYVKVIDGRTYEVTAPTVQEALNLLL